MADDPLTPEARKRKTPSTEVVQTTGTRGRDEEPADDLDPLAVEPPLCLTLKIAVPCDLSCAACGGPSSGMQMVPCMGDCGTWAHRCCAGLSDWVKEAVTLAAEPSHRSRPRHRQHSFTCPACAPPTAVNSGCECAMCFRHVALPMHLYTHAAELGGMLGGAGGVGGISGLCTVREVAAVEQALSLSTDVEHNAAAVKSTTAVKSAAAGRPGAAENDKNTFFCACNLFLTLALVCK
jgi:hypothetical protein